MDSVTKKELFAYIALGVVVYIAGAGALFFGLHTGGRILSTDFPQAFDAMNYFWLALFTGCAFPGLGTAFIFFFLNWLLGRLLGILQITDVSSHVAAAAGALLLSVGLTFGLGIYMVYNYVHAL